MLMALNEMALMNFPCCKFQFCTVLFSVRLCCLHDRQVYPSEKKQQASLSESHS